MRLQEGIGLAATLGFGAAMAQGTSCESKAVDKNGKVLVGAAKTSFLTKCGREACEPKAVDKNGKALTGAAKESFLAKCKQEGRKSRRGGLTSAARRRTDSGRLKSLSNASGSLPQTKSKKDRSIGPALRTEVCKKLPEIFNVLNPAAARSARRKSTRAK